MEGIENTLKVFPACRKGRLKEIEICWLASYKFRSVTASQTSTSPRKGAELRSTTFDYRKRPMISFWNVRTLFANGIEDPQNTRCLQLERQFQRHKLHILDLRGARWYDSGKYSSTSSGSVVLQAVVLWKAVWQERRIKLSLTATAKPIPGG